MLQEQDPTLEKIAAARVAIIQSQILGEEERSVKLNEAHESLFAIGPEKVREYCRIYEGMYKDLGPAGPLFWSTQEELDTAQAVYHQISSGLDESYVGEMLVGWTDEVRDRFFVRDAAEFLPNLTLKERQLIINFSARLHLSLGNALAGNQENVSSQE
jgi:hypothetical protein